MQLPCRWGLRALNVNQKTLGRDLARAVNRLDHRHCNSRCHCGDAIYGPFDNLHILHLFELHMATAQPQSVLADLILNDICNLRSLTIKEDEIKTRPPPIFALQYHCAPKDGDNGAVSNPRAALLVKMGVSLSGSIILGTARCVQTCSGQSFPNVCQVIHCGLDLNR